MSLITPFSAPLSGRCCSLTPNCVLSLQCGLQLLGSAPIVGASLTLGWLCHSQNKVEDPHEGPSAMVLEG